jgi:Ca-activated chloride channel family protein
MAERGSSRAPGPGSRPPISRRIAEALVPYGLLLVVAGTAFAGIALALRWRGLFPVTWGRPWVLWLLAAIPLVALRQFTLGGRRASTMSFPRTADLAAAAATWTRHLIALPKVLRMVALALGVLALARPQHPTGDLTEVEGIDVVIALDVSESMQERDLRPSRLDAAKEVLRRFIDARKSDRIGLVIFGREAFTQCPLTLDYHALAGLLADVRIGLVDGRGTAIGNALGTALNRLRKSDARSKVVILLTDGENNAGNLAPLQAARYGQSLGIKIFTVLMGRDVSRAEASDPLAAMMRGAVRYPVNPKLLEEIAGLTGGTPYLATDTAALERRFQAILDELDRSRIRDVKGKPEELFPPLVSLALSLLLVEIALSLTRFRRFP